MECQAYGLRNIKEHQLQGLDDHPIVSMLKIIIGSMKILEGSKIHDIT